MGLLYGLMMITMGKGKILSTVLLIEISILGLIGEYTDIGNYEGLGLGVILMIMGGIGISVIISIII